MIFRIAPDYSAQKSGWPLDDQSVERRGAL